MALAEDLLAVLDDPTHMWSHALRESSQDSQRLFLTLPLLPQPISADDLQVAYSAQRFNQNEPFLDSLRALEDSFISIGAGYEDRRWVRFRNPSLQDFSYEYLNRYSDWLDRLLSNPVYYEQVSSVYNIAMSRLPGYYVVSKRLLWGWIHHEVGLKFTGIRNWVVSRHDDLITKALDLALSAPEVLTSHEKQDLSARLKELVDFILMFGEPSGESAKQSLGNLIARAFKPIEKSAASTMFDLLRLRNTADLIERYSATNAMEVLRTNILDKDAWKFSVLLQIDEFLEIASKDSLLAWGYDYIDYVDEFIEEMSHSEDNEDLESAIKELEGISSRLGIDLTSSISALETQRSSLPSKEEDEDYESYDAKSSSKSSGSSRELDNIFASLLE